LADEFSFINRITPQQLKQASCIIGIGDDAAVYRANKQDQVVCVDTMCEEIHFSRKTMAPFDIGWKALAVNISDIAAMGATPLYFLVSIAVPEGWREEELFTIYDGMNAVAERYHIDLIGGDTVSTKGSLVITVTVIGEVEKERVLLRKNAQPEDIVFVTGTLGDAAAGLHVLLNRDNKENEYSDDEKYLIGKHQRPVPQVEVGNMLSSLQERVSLNDISDGLASECHELAEASNISIELDEENLPISNALKNYSKQEQLEWVYYGGEDFQLVGTASKDTYEKIKEKAKKMNVRITKIGQVLPRSNTLVSIRNNGDKKELKKMGFNHFRKGEK
jgi:thiamine-monophosphate kinase